MPPATSEPPPQLSLPAHFRRLFRSLAALNKTRYWLLTRAAWLILTFVVLFMVDGCLIGWSRAYEVMVGITSPAAVGAPFASWGVSVLGWLMIPAFVGGVVGYVVNSQIDARRTQTEDDVAEGLRRRARASRRHSGGGGQ
ncbi:DUF6313 family protein [Planotetraspora sp. GP83]|uniref:DUF6313 family protein n=1 Tax=Planotetraspora sp. GP83 TaxID=3156264 RepID=UPI003513A9E0